jgi:uncharacterized protein YndB with AHSA1/START domain
VSGIRLVRDYPHPPAKVWRALTDPALIARWGMRPEGFAPVVGTRFRFVARPNPGRRGFVECEVLEVRPPSLLRYSWVGNEKSPATYVAFRLEPHEGGTRLTFEHTGFVGAGGFALANLIMKPGWKKTFRSTFPAVLAGLDPRGSQTDSSSTQP